MSKNALVRLGTAYWQTDKRRIFWTNEDGVIDEASELKLTQKQFQLLESLYAHAPNAVNNNELVKVIWGDQPISAESLPQLINKTRNSLRDSSKTIIVHERGSGYKLNVTRDIDLGRLVENNKQKKTRFQSVKFDWYQVAIVLLSCSLLFFGWEIYSNLKQKDDFISIMRHAPKYPKITKESDVSIEFEFLEYKCNYERGHNEIKCEK